MNPPKIVYGSKPQLHIHLSTHGSPGKFFELQHIRITLAACNLTTGKQFGSVQGTTWPGAVLVAPCCPPSTCFTGSSLVPVDQRGNVLKCHILPWAQSQSSLQLMLIMSRHLPEREAVAVCWQSGHSLHSDCKDEWPAPPPHLPSPSPPPALYLLMDPFNYLPHILGRQQARAEYTGWRWYSTHAPTAHTPLIQGGPGPVELSD